MSVATESKNRITTVDGLRGIAILAVLVNHGCSIGYKTTGYEAWNWVIGLGNLGGHLFMLMSGYLITKSLSKETNLSKKPSKFFGDYYLKRFLRIYPLYFLCYLLYVVAMPLAYEIITGKVDKVYSVPSLVAASYITLTTNFKYLFSDVGYGFDVSWTIALLEQFYLFWIPCVYFLSRSNLKKLCIFLIVAAIISRPIASYLGVSYSIIHVMVPFRMDAIAIGCLFALLQGEKTKVEYKWLLPTKYLVTGSFVLFLWYFSDRGLDWRSRFVYTYLDVVCSLWLAVTLGLAGENRIPFLVRWQPIQKYGLRSYPIYLIHMAVITVIDVGLSKIFGKQQIYSLPDLVMNVSSGLIAIVACYPIGYVMYYVIEKRVTEWLLKRKMSTLNAKRETVAMLPVNNDTALDHNAKIVVENQKIKEDENSKEILKI